jgi:ATP-dependent DNA helicase RecG
MSIDLATPLVKALGARAAGALETQLSLHTVGDLLRHYPRRYVDRGRLTDIAGLEIGEHITVVAQVEKATLRDMRSRSGKLLAVVIRDEKGAELDCTFFNGHRLKSLVKPGVRAVFSGKVGVFNRKLQLTHPQFETLDEDDEVRPFISVYPATGKLGSLEIGKDALQELVLFVPHLERCAAPHHRQR